MLDGLARAKWWVSDVPGAIVAWERATPPTVGIAWTSLPPTWPSSCPASTLRAWGTTPLRAAGWLGAGMVEPVLPASAGRDVVRLR
jgi:hypothetical protein